MNLRHAVLTCAGVYLFAGCSNAAGPGNNVPSCGATGTPLALGVGAYSTIDPAADGTALLATSSAEAACAAGAASAAEALGLALGAV